MQWWKLMPSFSGQSDEVTQNFELNAGQGQWDLSFFTEIFPWSMVFQWDLDLGKVSYQRLENEATLHKMTVKQLGESPVQITPSFHFQKFVGA